jgi:transposase
MSSKRTETTNDTRKIAIQLYNSGKTLAEVGKIVGRSTSTVQYIIKRFKETGKIENKPRIRNRFKLDERDDRFILREIKKNPKLSAPKLVEMLKLNSGKTVCAETIRRVLRSNNFHGRVARRKPYISEANRRKRISFAKQFKNHGFSFWKNVIFTDESKY